MSKRIRLGKSIEGRDEKGIKKTVCAFLKVLHPNGPPTDEEFEEYVAYATECRRRHEIVLQFLLRLGLDAETAERDAEGIEHHVSERTLDLFRAFVGQQ